MITRRARYFSYAWRVSSARAHCPLGIGSSRIKFSDDFRISVKMKQLMSGCVKTELFDVGQEMSKNLPIRIFRSLEYSRHTVPYIALHVCYRCSINGWCLASVAEVSRDPSSYANG